MEKYAKTSLRHCLLVALATSSCLMAKEWSGSAGTTGYSQSLNAVQSEQVGTSGALLKSFPLAPSVSAIYNSSAGNWSIGGFSSITRSAKWGTPTYTDSDIFEFNGNELIEVSRSNDKIEYIAENNQYSRFTYFRPNTASSYWLIEHKNGSKVYFGADQNGQIDDAARFESQGQPTGVTPSVQPLRWAIKYELDSTQDNFTSYHYAKAQTGERWQVLKKIVQGKVNAAQFRCVSLAHESKIHPISNYSRGAQDKDMFRVVAVMQELGCDQHGQGGTPINGVKIGWELRPVTQKDQVSYFEEYGNDLVAEYTTYNQQQIFTGISSGSTMPKTLFSYADGNMAVGNSSSWVLPEYANTNQAKGWLRYSESQVLSRDSAGNVLNTFHLTKRNFIDMNGDGLLDRVIHPGIHYSQAGEFFVALNDGAGFGSYQSWPIAYGALTVSKNSKGYSDLMDINGDGRPDLVAQLAEPNSSWTGQLNVQLNHGSGFEPEQTWGTPGHSNMKYLRMGTQYRKYQRDISVSRYDYVDFNGDGLPDRVERMTANGSNSSDEVSHLNVWLNLGHGLFSNEVKHWNLHGDSQDILFELDASFKHNQQQSGAIFAYDATSVTQLKDMNGDGLVDLIYQNSDTNLPEHSGNLMVAYNTGHFFAEPVSWGNPGNVGFLRSARHINNQAPKNQNVMFDYMDVNGDGRPDRLIVKNNGQVEVYFNHGNGFASEASVISGLNLESLRYNVSRELDSENGDADDSFDGQGNDFLDINGDGLLDWVYYNAENPDNSLQIRLMSAETPNDSLLTTIRTNTGGSIEFEYRPIDRSQNPDYRRKSWVLSTVTSDDGLQEPTEISYSFEGAFYNAEERLDYGFETVTQHFATGDSLAATYYQNKCFAGNVRSEVLRDANGMVHRISNNIMQDLSQRANDIHYGRSQTRPLAGPDLEVCSAAPMRSTQINADGKTQFVEWQSGWGLKPKNVSGWIGQLTRFDNYDAQGNVLAKLSGSINDNFQWINYSKFYHSYTAHDSRWMFAPKESRVQMKHSDGVYRNVTHNRYYYDGMSLGNISRGRLTKQGALNDYGQLIYLTTDYDVYGNIASATDAMGRRSTYLYDEQLGSYLRRTRSPSVNGVTISKLNSYDQKWNLTSFTDGIKTVNQAYDSFGRLTQKSGDTTQVTIEYHDFDNSLTGDNSLYSWIKKTLADDSPDGVHQSYIYLDGFGNSHLTKKEHTDEQENKVWKTEVGFSFTQDNQTVKKLIIPYVSSNPQFEHLTSSTTKPALINRSYLSSGLGAVAEKQLPNGAVSKKISTDSKVVTIDGLGHVLEVVQEPQSNRTYVKQFTGVYPNHTFEAQTIKEEYPDRARFYNADGHLVRTDYLSYKGNILRQVDADRGEHSFEYDNNSFITAKTNGKGETTYFHYDNLGRKTLIDYPNQTDTRFYYDGDIDGDGVIEQVDARGSLSYVTDASGWTKLYHDRLGRLSHETKMINGMSAKSIYFQYGQSHNLKAYRLPGEGKTGTGWNTIEYNDSGAVESITDIHGTQIVRDIDSDRFGRLSWVAFNDDISAQYIYHGPSKNYRMARFVSRRGTQPYSNMYYDFDLTGNLISLYDRRDIDQHNLSFAYDHLNRLSKVSDKWFINGSSDYAYTPSGNIIEKDGKNFSYFDGTHKLLSDSTFSYQYDENGNVISMSHVGHLVEKDESFVSTNSSSSNQIDKLLFEYNDEGRLASMEQLGNENNQVDYLYDYRGKLVKAVSSNETTYYFNGYYEVRNGQETKYHYVSDQRAVKVTGDKTEYILSDFLGSASVIFEANGGWRKQIYDPFGKLLGYKGSINDAPDYGFTGKESFLNDMMHMGARFYNPNTGRFISPDSIYDPLHPTQGANRYSYVSNNPLKFNDPTGHNGNKTKDALDYLIDGYVGFIKGVDYIIPGYKDFAVNTFQFYNDTIAAADEWNFKQEIFMDGKVGDVSTRVSAVFKVGEVTTEKRVAYDVRTYLNNSFVTIKTINWVKQKGVRYDFNNNSEDNTSGGQSFIMEFGLDNRTTLKPGWKGAIQISFTISQATDDNFLLDIANAIAGLRAGAGMDEVLAVLAEKGLDSMVFKLTIYGQYGTKNGVAGVRYSVDASAADLPEAFEQLEEYVQSQDEFSDADNEQPRALKKKQHKDTTTSTGGGANGNNIM